MKNGKKIALAVTAGCIAVTMMVSGTLAWFTDRAQSTNVITTGDVSIKLTETKYENGAVVTSSDSTVRTEEGNDASAYFEGGLLEPGAKILKDPTVTNDGSNAAYIRAKLEYTATAPEGVTAPTFAEFMTLTGMTFNTAADANGGKWLVPATADTMTLYYDKALAPSTSTDSMFTITSGDNGSYTIYFDGAKVGNAYKDMTFQIKVTAEAIQTKNVGTLDGTTAASAKAFWDTFDTANIDFDTGIAAVTP